MVKEYKKRHSNFKNACLEDVKDIDHGVDTFICCRRVPLCGCIKLVIYKEK